MAPDHVNISFMIVYITIHTTEQAAEWYGVMHLLLFSSRAEITRTSEVEA